MSGTQRYYFAFIAAALLFLGVTSAFLMVQTEVPMDDGGPIDLPVEAPVARSSALEIAAVHRAGRASVAETFLDASTLALAFADGAIEWWRLDGSGEPDVLRRASAPGSTIDLCGLEGGALVSVHAGSRPRLLRHSPPGTEGSGSELLVDTVDLEGTPLDVWCEGSGDAAWVLLRTEQGGLLDRIAGSPPARTRRLETGPLPVGIFDPDGGRLLVPEYGGRVVHEVSLESEHHVSHAIDVRPATLGLVAGAIIAAPANEPAVVRIPPGPSDPAKPPGRLAVRAPLSLIRSFHGRTLGFAASTSSLTLFDDAMTALVVSEAFDQVVAIEALDDPAAGATPVPLRALVLDSGAHPRLALIDVPTLDIVFEFSIEGRPARLHRQGETVVVISPAEGTISFFELRR